MITNKQIVVRNTDMDSQGRVNNAVYFVFMGEGRLDHAQRLGLIPGRQRENWDYSLGTFAVIEATARFRAPSYRNDVLTIKTITKSIGTRSFVFAYRIVKEPEQALIAEGSSVQVWVTSEGNPMELPPSIRAALEASLTPEEALASDE